MKSSFFLLWLTGFLTLQAQTRINHLESLEGIKIIRFFLDEVTNVQILSTQENILVVKMLQDGEYASFLQLKIVREKSEMSVYNQKNLTFPNYDDKLSAHKIIAQEAVIELPEDIIVYFESNTSNLKASGKFKNLTAQLLNGDANLLAFDGNAKIYCANGNIHAIVISGLIHAEAQAGNFISEKIPEGKNLIYLKTLSGNIDVRKTK
ncbi:MAG: hypothetical protein CO119_02630 [Flavobacteriales bacterium CG_4_9_14_3_um_filter_40_17]|nr:MAG: hypothetical protein CO119_02630 [Flavobacteriales bacterium CG_4_9_14_3_um_filter_40_17]